MTEHIEKLARAACLRNGEDPDAETDALHDNGALLWHLRAEAIDADLKAAGLEVNKAGSFAQLKIFGDQARACIADDEPGRHSAWEHPVALDVTLEDFRTAAALTKEG